MKRKRLRGAQIDRWADAIESRDLQPLALPVLDALDTFGFLAGHALFAVEPLVRTRPGSLSGQLADLLLRPGLGSKLRHRLTSRPRDHD